MVKVCHPIDEQELSLKKAWKWLKTILDEYMSLKKQINTRAYSALNVR